MKSKPEQFMMNHWSIHQAPAGECSSCDIVAAWNKAEDEQERREDAEQE